MDWRAWFNFNEWQWQKCRSCPVARAEGAGARVGSRFYLLGGFHTIDKVVDRVEVLDLNEQRWVDSFPMHSDMAHTHVGMVSDGRRFIYAIAGQKGPQCSPAIADCFVLDTQTNQWNKLPALPEARYAPTVQLWKGRLHVISGSKKDRITPATDHWSLAVNEGKTPESSWRREPDVPKGGPHRNSLIIDDQLYMFGGELGDVKAVDGDPQFKCDWSTPMEIIFGDSFRLARPGAHWEPIAPMPFPTTHMECSIFQTGSRVVMAGGNRSRAILSDLIQVFDVPTNTWSLAGRLPYRMKTITTYYDGWLYVITGQKAKSSSDPYPGEVLSGLWRKKLSF